MVFEDIVRLLSSSGVPFGIHEHEPVTTMQDVEAKLPFPKDCLLKSLVFKVGTTWVAAVIKAADRLDYRMLADACGVKREALCRPTVDELAGELGVEPGGISPILGMDGQKVIFDRQVFGMSTVFCGVGRNDRTLEIAVRDLVQVSRGEVYQIVRS